MVASDSPASDFFDGDREPGQSSTQAAQQLSGGIDADGESGDTDQTGGETGGGSAVMDAGGTPAASLANRAAGFDNPIAEGVLYGLASLFAAFGDGSSVDPAGVDGSEDADLTAGTDESGDGDFAESGVGGEFGDALTADDLEDEYDGDAEAADGDGDELDGEEVGSDGGDRTANGDADGDDDPEAGDEQWDGDDTDSGKTDGTESDEWESGTADDGSTGDTDGDDSESNESADREGEVYDRDSGSTDAETETDSSDETGDAETESADDDADWGDDETATETERDDSSDDMDDEIASGEDSGGDDSGPMDSVPGLSDGVVTTALVAVAVLVVASVFYTRENPIGTLLSIPGRIVSLALAGVVACSQALERAVSALRGLRSIAELPGLVLTTLEDAFRSAGTRVRTVRSSLFGGGDGATGGTDAEIHVTARERIRRAFESVIDASPMYRGRVATVTPTEVARSARDAGAPAEPVETITDSFRDVEYGERDPESYLERTTTAHERLRAELETDAETADEPDGSGETDE